jgi:hypothetical protein
MAAEQRRLKRNIFFNPIILLLVDGYAKARGITRSQAVDALLHEALRHHEIDAEANEVL